MAEYKKLPFSKVIKDVTRNYSKIPKTEYLKEGLYPIIDQGKDFICGYTNDFQKVTRKDKPVIIFGDHTRIFKFIEFPIAIGADGVKVLEVDTEIADEKFIYEYLRTIYLHNAGYSRHFKYLKEVTIPIPDSIDVQKRIATVLQKTDYLINQRKESIELADEFLKHTFLTMFRERSGKDSLFGSIVDIQTGQIDPNESPYDEMYHIGGASIESNSGKLSNYRKAKEENLVSGKYFFTKNHVLYSKIRPNLNKVSCPTFDGICSADIYPLLPKPKKITKHFLRFELTSPRFLNYAKNNSDRANIPKINRKALNSYRLNLPDYNLQLKFEDIVVQLEQVRELYIKSLLELSELYRTLSYKAFNGELAIIDKIEIEGSIKIQPKISGKIEVIETKELEDDGYRSYTNDRTEPWHFGIEEVDSKIKDEPDSETEEVASSITHMPFLKTEEDLLSHISRNCSGSHFTFEDIKEAVKGLDWTYDFEELKNLVFCLVRKKQLKQIFADASYKAGFNKTDAAHKEITDLSEQIYFKRVL